MFLCVKNTYGCILFQCLLYNMSFIQLLESFWNDITVTHITYILHLSISLHTVCKGMEYKQQKVKLTAGLA